MYGPDVFRVIVNVPSQCIKRGTYLGIRKHE